MSAVPEVVDQVIALARTLSPAERAAAEEICAVVIGRASVLSPVIARAKDLMLTLPVCAFEAAQAKVLGYGAEWLATSVVPEVRRLIAELKLGGDGRTG